MAAASSAWARSFQDLRSPSRSWLPIRELLDVSGTQPPYSDVVVACFIGDLKKGCLNVYEVKYDQRVKYSPVLNVKPLNKGIIFVFWLVVFARFLT